MFRVNRSMAIVAVSAAQATVTFAVVLELARRRRKARSAAWDVLVNARSGMKTSLEAGNSRAGEDAAQWIGGGLAALGAITGEDPRALLLKLSDQIPMDSNDLAPRPGDLVKSPDSQAQFRAIERERPPPHPGAPKPIDPHDLTPEEREEYGVLLPEEMILAREGAEDGDVG